MPFSIGQRFNQCFPIQTTTSKNHMQSLASSPLLLNAGAENIPLPCLLMAPDLLCHKKDRRGGLFACMGNERQHGAWQDSIYAR